MGAHYIFTKMFSVARILSRGDRATFFWPNALMTFSMFCHVCAPCHEQSNSNALGLPPLTPHLLAQYAAAVSKLTSQDIDNPISVPALLMERAHINGRCVDMMYAPFDHVNAHAKVVIVGMTPGKFQAANALRSAQQTLRQGKSIEQAAADAKVHASFSGEPMRGNLVRMLDAIGVAKLLGIGSTARLWGDQSALVHFTSALRYPVFVDGQNWSGQPNMVRSAPLRKWLEAYTATELQLLGDAVIVPLGPKVAEAMRHLAKLGFVDEARILDGLPHPSGANAERIAYFLGDKAAERCSPKTNTKLLDDARHSLCQRVAQLQRH